MSYEIRLIFLVFLAGSVLTDLAEHKIYKFWVYPAFLTGLLYRITSGSVRELILLAAILIVVQTASLICFSCGAAGAGDGRFLLTVCVYLRHGSLGDFAAAALVLSGTAAAAVWLATGDRHKPLPLSLPLGIAALMQIR